MKLKLKLKRFGSGYGFYVASSVFSTLQLQENKEYILKIENE